MNVKTNVKTSMTTWKLIHGMTVGVVGKSHVLMNAMLVGKLNAQKNKKDVGKDVLTATIQLDVGPFGKTAVLGMKTENVGKPFKTVGKLVILVLITAHLCQNQVILVKNVGEKEIKISMTHAVMPVKTLTDIWKNILGKNVEIVSKTPV